MIESLETRRLMTDVSLINGRLQILGSDAPDVVGIALHGKTQADVFVDNAVVLTFDLSDVRLVSFAGKGGNDSLILGRVPLKTYMDGGDGDDALSASQTARRDTLIGGPGNDYLFGGAGRDLLDGGVGYDTMLGHDGNDTIRALSDLGGDDVVSGGEGFDVADVSGYDRGIKLNIGDRGPRGTTVDDVIFEDVDSVIATPYSDIIAVLSNRPLKIDLGAGDDTFYGGVGDETIIGGSGFDQLLGGGGSDEAFIDADDIVRDITTLRDATIDLSYAR